MHAYILTCIPACVHTYADTHSCTYTYTHIRYTPSRIDTDTGVICMYVYLQPTAQTYQEPRDSSMRWQPPGAEEPLQFDL